MSTERTDRELMMEVLDRLIRLEEQRTPELTVFSLNKAAQKLGVSLSTMKRMVATSEIRTATVGKREMIPLAELTRVANHERPKQQKAAKAAAWVHVPKKRARRLDKPK